MGIQKKLQRSWSSLERVSKIPLLMVAASTLAACTSSFSAQAKHTRNVAQGAVRIRLFDAYSGSVLANTDVAVRSDNGIVCEQSPCPQNSQTWSGRSDEFGALTIPPSATQFHIYVQPKDHRLSKLAVDAITGSSDIYPIELYPEWLFNEQHEWTRGYKLVDARSGRALANILVHIEFPGNDWTAQNGGVTHLDVRTNSLGYVFFSFLRKPEAKEKQTLPSAPLADWMTPEASVVVFGYRKAKLNYFEGNDAERFTMRLERQ